MLKKCLYFALCLTITAASMSGIVSVSADALGDTIWYYNTFDKKGSDLKNETNDYLSVNVGNSDVKKGTEFNGNPGIGTGIGDGRIDTPGLTFDFTKGGTITGKTEGVYKISFDFAVNSQSSADYSTIGINMVTSYSGGLMMRIYKANGKIRYAFANEITTPPGLPETAEALEDNKLYKLDIIFDYNSRLVYYYLNGEILRSTADKAHQEIPDVSAANILNSFSLSPSGIISYIDNIKISELSDGTNFGFSDMTAFEDAAYYDLKSTKAVKPMINSITLDGAEVENYEWLDTETIRIYSDDALNIGKHNVKIEGIYDFFGNEANDTDAVINIEERQFENHTLFNESFKNGADDLPEYDTTNGYSLWQNDKMYVYLSGTEMRSTGTVNGVKGLRITPGNGWTDWVSLFLDFTKNGTTEPIGVTSDKVMKISFDFAVRNDSENTYRPDSVGAINCGRTSPRSGLAFVMQKAGSGEIKFGYDASTTNNPFYPTDNSQYAAELTSNKVHTMDIYITHRSDYEIGQIHYYIDGQLIKSADASSRNQQDIYGNSDSSSFKLSNFGLTFSDILTYFGNLDVSEVVTDSFRVLNAERLCDGDKTISVNVNEVPDLNTANVSVTKKDGSSAEVKSVTRSNNRTINIELAESAVLGETYTVTFGDDFKNVFGKTVNEWSKIIKAKVVKRYSISNGLLTISVQNTSDNSVSPIIMVAEYDNGRLCKIKVIEKESLAPGEIGTYENEDVSGFGDNAKVYVFESLSNLRPMLLK